MFNEDFFVYIAAFGLFTDVSYETKQSMKNVLGHLAYVLEGAKRIFNVPSYHIRVEHDGEVLEEDFMFGMVTNSRSVGGFRGIILSLIHISSRKISRTWKCSLFSNKRRSFILIVPITLSVVSS